MFVLEQNSTDLRLHRWIHIVDNGNGCIDRHLHLLQKVNFMCLFATNGALTTKERKIKERKKSTTTPSLQCHTENAYTQDQYQHLHRNDLFY